jgi:hypothetical protein
VHQAVPLQRIQLLAGPRDDALLDDLRERQVEVVAAEQQVIADGGAREPVAARVDIDQREVGGATTDVEHEDALARRELALRRLATRDPRIERGLRFLQQRNILQPRLSCRLQGEVPRRGIK